MAQELTRSQVNSLFPKRNENANKADFGYIALVGGCVKYSGAIRLADMANTAMRCGAGVCSLAVPNCIVKQITPKILESTIFPLSSDDENLRFVESEFDELINRNSVIAFGMGIGNTPETRKALEYLLKNFEGTLIVDADGINAMAKMDEKDILDRKCELVITPHPKEFSRLSKKDISDVLNEPEKNAKELANKLACIVLLKGHETYISDGTDSYLVNRGTPGMASAGSGDVLSGILAAILAVNDDKLLATAAGAYINGLAGEIASEENSETTHIASDTVLAIKTAIESLSKKEEAVIVEKPNRLGLNILSAILIAAIAFCGAWLIRGGIDNKTPAALNAPIEGETDYLEDMQFLLKDIYIDGKLVNNYELYRPFFRVDGRIFIPLTDDVCKALGIKAKWDNNITEVFITQDVASHEGIFYDKFGWNLKDMTAMAKAGVVLHLINGEDEEIEYLSNKDVFSCNNGETVYIALALLKDDELIHINAFYDDMTGLYISTDKDIDAASYYSENNNSYITARSEYIHSFRDDLSVGECSIYEYIFRHESRIRELDEDLLLSLARTESKFNRYSVSGAGALGIMQIMPETAKAHEIALEDCFDVHTSVQFGASYLANALKHFNGDRVKALSVYNFGGVAVQNGEYDTYFADTILTRYDEMRKDFEEKGYSNTFLTVIECTK